ncbi:TPA: hypothetical protein ACN348_004197 [Vibrio parahaemolyticus]|uniref:hypothetical protein n=1 Tax=Vibrio parahaemolyticus TaxID=670 RepID=UPI0024077488|nr:hypothetical protein [Vibrio parahaemolyticus]
MQIEPIRPAQKEKPLLKAALGNVWLALLEWKLGIFYQFIHHHLRVSVIEYLYTAPEGHIFNAATEQADTEIQVRLQFIQIGEGSQRIERVIVPDQLNRQAFVLILEALFDFSTHS